MGIAHHRDISHTFGVILKKHYGNCIDFKKLTEIMEKNRLKYHLTDKAIFLPPKQRAIARFITVPSGLDGQRTRLASTTR